MRKVAKEYGGWLKKAKAKIDRQQRKKWQRGIWYVDKLRG